MKIAQKTGLTVDHKRGTMQKNLAFRIAVKYFLIYCWYGNTEFKI
jgi:hypothetical protein